MKDDIRFAVRLLRRQPGLYSITVGGLTVAIGLATAVFAIVDAVTARGYGVREPKSVYRAVLVTSANPNAAWIGADYRRLEQMTPGLSLAAAGYSGTVSVPQPGEVVDPEKLSVGAITPVTGSYFSVLGGRAAIGRTLAPRDDAPGAPTVAVISHAYWTGRLGADPAILGRTIRITTGLGEFPVTIVGIAERAFTGPVPLNYGPSAGWITFTAEVEAVSNLEVAVAAQQRQRLADLRARSSLDAGEREALKTLDATLITPRAGQIPYMNVVGRLAPGVTREQAESQLSALTTALAAERGVEGSLYPAVRLIPIDDRRSASIMGISVTVLIGALAVVVALACANVMNLLLASAAGRSREIGTRLALGATGGRIVRQLLTESLLLASIAGGAGAALAMAAPIGTIGPVGLANGTRGLNARVSREYFDAVATPVVRGRTFTADEIDSGANVVVISAALAQAFWGQSDPIGDRLDRVLPAGAAAPQTLRGLSDARSARIVGVVGDVTTSLGRYYQAPTVYMPLSARADNLVNATLVVRTATDPQALVRVVADALRAIDPEVPQWPRLVRDGWRRELQAPKTLATLSILVGLCALGLSIVGIIGVTSYVVGQRQHEVGVRIALGASRARILGLLFRESLRPVMIGLAFGLAAALVAIRSMRAMLPAISPSDPIAVGVAIVVLLVAATAAVLVPVRRTASMNPAHVLRRS